MLSFFFNRFSRVVIVMEAVGLLCMARVGVRLMAGEGSMATKVLFAIVVFLYAFMRFCASHPWYKDAPRGSGIELHFKKMMVAASYILALLGLVLLFWLSAIPIVVALLLLAIVAHINVILLFLRAKDRDPTPVNYFSSGAFLDHDAK
jgi:hypothetical protein